MKPHFPPPTASELTRFLRGHFDPSAGEIEDLSCGWFSYAYGFTASGQAYVIRLNAWQVDLRKDELAWRCFSRPDLPVPEMLQLAPFDIHCWYAITRRCQGLPPEKLPQVEQDALIQPYFDSIYAILSTNISAFPGWGLAGSRGSGLFPSIQRYLLTFWNHKFCYDWRHFLQDGRIVEKPFITAYRELEYLAGFLPAERYLVHGDFGQHNLIAWDGRITGVLDWAEMQYGDFVDDVSTLETYTAGIPFARLWATYAAQKGLPIPHYEERMRFCLLRYHMAEVIHAAYLNDAGAIAENMQILESFLTSDKWCLWEK
jgi:hygromycin-B 4-O-kinase